MSIPSREAFRIASPVSGQPGEKPSHSPEQKIKTQRITRSASKRLGTSATPVTSGIVLSHRTITPEKPESMSVVSTATVTPEPRKQHSTDNRAPLFKYAPEIAIPRTPKTDWLMRWNDISPIKKKGNEASKRNLTEQIKSYIQSMDDDRETWLNTRMMARKSDGAIFPALKDQSEVIAGCNLKAFELLGHYAGEIHNEDTLPDLIDSAGLVNISSYQMSLSNNCTLSAFGCGNVCSLINAPNTATSAPKGKSQARPAAEANVAPIRVSYKGQECALMVTLKPVKRGETLWYDYGPKYWHQLQVIKSLESSETPFDTLPEAIDSLNPEAQAMITDSEISTNESEDLEATRLPNPTSQKRKTKQPTQSVKKIRTEAQPSQQSQMPLTVLPASVQAIQFVHHQVRIEFIRAMCRLFNNANIARAPKASMHSFICQSQQCFPEYWYPRESLQYKTPDKEEWMYQGIARVKMLFDQTFKFTPLLTTYFVRNPIPCCVFMLSQLFPDSLREVKIADLIARLKAFPVCAGFTDDQLNKFLQSNCINIQTKDCGQDRLYTVSLTTLYQKAYRSAYIDYLCEQGKIDKKPRVQFLQVCQWISESKSLRACLTTERANEILALLCNLLNDCNIPFNKLIEDQEAETGISQPPPPESPSVPSPECLPVTVKGNLVTIDENNVDRILPQITETLASYFRQSVIPVPQEVQSYIVLAALLTLMEKGHLFAQKAQKLKHSAGKKQLKDICATMRRASVTNAGLVQTKARDQNRFQVSGQLKGALINALTNIGYQLP